jgi:hypothetical protein
MISERLKFPRTTVEKRLKNAVLALSTRVFRLFWFDLGPVAETALDHARAQERAQNQGLAADEILVGSGL